MGKGVWNAVKRVATMGQVGSGGRGGGEEVASRSVCMPSHSSPPSFPSFQLQGGFSRCSGAPPPLSTRRVFYCLFVVVVVVIPPPFDTRFIPHLHPPAPRPSSGHTPRPMTRVPPPFSSFILLTSPPLDAFWNAPQRGASGGGRLDTVSMDGTGGAGGGGRG